MGLRPERVLTQGPPLEDRVRAEAFADFVRGAFGLSPARGIRVEQISGRDPVGVRREVRDANPDQPVGPLVADLVEQAAADMLAVDERDPACRSLLQPFLYFKGFHSLLCYRIAHRLWRDGRDSLAFHMQSRMSERFGVDIHPAAQLGRGIMIDHAHSIVIGETAVVGDNVSMLHSVTLGGTGKEDGDRHPKIGDGVLIGAGAKVLGNIHVGANSRIAAGSVVLADVPPCKTVAGIPAKIVGEAGCAQPALSMDHRFKN